MREFNPLIAHPSVADLESKYEMVKDLWAGTDAMRDAGTTYLPREPAEAPANYTRRLNRTVLFPAYKQAIQSAVGKLFAKKVDVFDATPEMTFVLENIDEDTNNLEVFAQQATRSALHYGCSYILIDYPVVNGNTAQTTGATPYWVLIEAPQLLEASPVKFQGKNRLGIFRFQEQIAYRKGEFEVGFQTQVKEFRLDVNTNTVSFKVFARHDERWLIEDEGILVGMTDIPIVPVYGNKVGYYLGSPTFYDLAEENVLNWQINSDYQNIVHMSGVPMLMVKGMAQNFDDAGNEITVVISPNTVLNFANPEADAKWVEVAGTSSAVVLEALQGSYERMSQMSLELINTNTSNRTATEVSIIAEESNSILRTAQDEIEDALTLAIDFTYQYLTTLNPGTTVELTTTEEAMDLTEPVVTEVQPQTDSDAI